MIFDKEFVSHLTNYINSNDSTSKKYLNAYYIKFLDILKVKDEKRQVINQGYRFWNFRDYDILNFIFDKHIEIKPSGFLSYYSNISNTKNMIDFLELNNETKLFYLIEEKRENLLRIYTPLENIERYDFVEEELKVIDETLSKYSIENEYVALDNRGYNLNSKNVKAMLVHERLADLLELKEVHKFSNGYCYVILNNENIDVMKMSNAFRHLIDKKYKLNNFGCILLDKFYDDNFNDRFIQKKEEEEAKQIKEVVDITRPVKVTFRPST